MRDLTQPLRPPTPGNAFSEQVADLLDQLDQARARAEAAEQERDEARAERDDLSIRTLPYLHTADWPPTKNPVGAVIAEQLDAEQAAPGFTGWN
jgi:hypothetical protein